MMKIQISESKITGYEFGDESTRGDHVELIEHARGIMHITIIEENGAPVGEIAVEKALLLKAIEAFDYD